jgi:dTDP-4-dehydrorhamnose 3,5-epimerase
MEGLEVKFTEQEIRGVYTIDLEERADDRGFFARTYCNDEFAAHGLANTMVQSNMSFNHRAGTIRGMHMQLDPHGEVKVVRAIRGAILDVIVDMRTDSPTYLRHVSVELTETNRRALYVPIGFAHGYQALTDAAEVLYQVSTVYAPGFEQGYRFDDPAFAISWRLPVSVISDKDAAWPLLGVTK